KLRMHGYTNNRWYSTGCCQGAGEPWEVNDQGQARSEPQGPARPADSPPSGDGDTQAPEDQEAAAGDYRPGQAHDQQGAVMDDYGTTQDPSRGDYVRPAQGEHREVPGPNPFYSVQPTPEMVEHMQMAASQYDLLRTNIKNSTH